MMLRKVNTRGRREGRKLLTNVEDECDELLYGTRQLGLAVLQGQLGLRHLALFYLQGVELARHLFSTHFEGKSSPVMLVEPVMRSRSVFSRLRLWLRKKKAASDWQRNTGL